MISSTEKHMTNLTELGTQRATFGMREIAMKQATIMQDLNKAIDLDLSIGKRKAYAGYQACLL